MITDQQRFNFNKKILKTDSCWNWIGALGYEGYGQFRLGKKLVGAHRVSLLMEGLDITGKLVCHHCDNIKCVRPSHLFVGSIQDNNQDRHSKGRTSSNENHYKSKLTNSQRQQIALEYPNAKKLYGGVQKMAEHYKVERTNLYRIYNKWKVK